MARSRHTRVLMLPPDVSNVSGLIKNQTSSTTFKKWKSESDLNPLFSHEAAQKTHCKHTNLLPMC